MEEKITVIDEEVFEPISDDGSSSETALIFNEDADDLGNESIIYDEEQYRSTKLNEQMGPTVGAFYNVHLYNHFVPANKADSCETYAPRLRLLRCLDDGSNNISWYEELVEEEGKFLVNPLNICDDSEYQREFLIKLRTAVMCAMSDIDV